MHIKELHLRNFRCFGDEVQVIKLGPELTTFIGDNGSGKTTVIRALQRLFGNTSTERSLTREDVHFGAGEVPGPPSADEDAIDGPKTVSSKQVYIEAILDFPELSHEEAGTSDNELDVSVETFHAMSCSGPGKPLQAKIRLEATWQFGIDEDDIEQKIYWVTTSEEVPFGDDDIAKTPMTAAQRKRVQLKYLPATRSNSAVVNSAMKELLGWLQKFGDFSSGKEKLESHRAELQAVFDELPAIKGVVTELTDNWIRLFRGELYSEARLTILTQEIHKAIRELNLTLSPSETGAEYAIEDLGSGPIDFYRAA